MSSPPKYVCCHRNRHLIISLLFLLVSSFTQVTFMAAEGRSLSRLLEVAQKGFEKEKQLVMRSLIGSRPPRCERRCSSCPNCEAIQVPVTTLSKNRRTRQFSAAFFSISYTRGNDISNYKPISWKCKCGNLVYDP
ncbi:retrotransposon-like protein 1-like [Hibiscus syriacus]|uniref:Epidermal patterning factor-like protein n=1 Tax=Hibiscus syriacus TaxID=106335 RepID=A0A6A2XK09_HIBSY|nr:EPIDERMAL PATTERNING FACTOR-like protein 2 [Hibiscus syriacus]KAE8658799.1 retrotransposon-like protein 1-like [Hibiscus syriacus]